MSRWGDKYVIGLTGNIAVGKSVVRQMLQHLGAYTIDADGLTHQAMQPGAPAYKPIVETFGQFILDESKRINRGMLGQIVFSNPQALAKLEAITHPIVGQAIDTLVKRAKQRVIVIEAIKLLEGSLAESVDTIWVVDASPETRLKRLMEKRNMPETAARQRITAQNPQNVKLSQADVVIKNDGNFEDTWKQVQAAWNLIRKAVITRKQPGVTDMLAQSRTTTKDPDKIETSPKRPDSPATKTPSAPPSTSTTPPTPVAPAKAAAGGAAAPVVKARRGMPNNAEAIARYISKMTGKTVERMDVMMAFGQKSYLLAQSEDKRLLGLIGWQVENLITRVDEVYLDSDVQIEPVVTVLTNAIEEASTELQSEVCYIFLPTDIRKEAVQSFLKNGYEMTTLEQIKVPAWREAASEMAKEDSQILSKRLREDRILKPI